MTDRQTPESTAPPDSWGPERSKTVSWHDPLPTAATGLTMSGLDYLRAMIEGRLPFAPIGRLVGFQGVSADPGEVVFRCRPDESTYNPIGLVHGGVVCTLLDSAAGCAVHTLLPAGIGYTSIEIKVNYLRPIRAGATLTVTGRVAKPGRRIAFAEAEAVDEAGKAVASATSSLLIFGADGG